MRDVAVLVAFGKEIDVPIAFQRPAVFIQTNEIRAVFCMRFLPSCARMNTTVEIPEEIAALAETVGGNVASGVRMAVVLDAYARGRVSAGRAGRLLGIERLAFEELRIERGIERPGSVREFAVVALKESSKFI